MPLYTGQGDDGRTLLIGGVRVDKDASRVAAYGEVDELNACLGLVRAAGPPEPLPSRLADIQNVLFEVGAHLATPPGSSVNPFTDGQQKVRRLEGWIDEASAGAPPLRNFVLPGGTEAAARLHLARAVCRRAERTMVGLMRAEPVDAQVLVFLNRLSDLLFAWARQVNHQAGAGDVIWKPRVGKT